MSQPHKILRLSILFLLLPLLGLIPHENGRSLPDGNHPNPPVRIENADLHHHSELGLQPHRNMMKNRIPASTSELGFVPPQKFSPTTKTVLLHHRISACITHTPEPKLVQKCKSTAHG